MAHEKLKMLTRIMKMIYIYVGADDPTVYAVTVTSNVGADDSVRPLPYRNT